MATLRRSGSKLNIGTTTNAYRFQKIPMLSVLYRVLRLFPFYPPAFQRINAAIAHFYEFLRHTGASRLIMSRAVENYRFLFSVFLGPGCGVLRIFPERASDLGAALFPIIPGSYIYNDNILIAKPALKFLF